jgi:hypothetical protein
MVANIYATEQLRKKKLKYFFGTILVIKSFGTDDCAF